MATQKIPLYIPTFINSATYTPARVLPHIYFYNGQVDCETWWTVDENNAPATQTKFPYFDHYNVVTGSFPTGDSQSLLFNNEAAVYGTAPTASLYSTYWEKYISFLYNPKTRVLNCQAIIPLADYFHMELNDVVNFRGNYWHLRAINDYSLKTGECNLQLVGPIISDTFNQLTPEPPAPNSASINWVNITSNDAPSSFKIYDNGNNVITSTTTTGGSLFVTASHTINAELDVTSWPSSGSVTMSLSVNGAYTFTTSSSSDVILSTSFTAAGGQTYSITGSVIYNTSTPTLIERLSVSQSLWAYYDAALTASYSGSGQTGITDLSGNGNNGSVDSSLVWKGIQSGSSAPLNSMVLFNPANAGNQITMPAVPASSFTMLVSWYGKNFNYVSSATEVFVGRDPEGYGIFNLDGTYNYRTLNIVNDTYDSLTYMPTNSGTGSAWHVSAFSFNTSTNNVNWCMDGTTGSYTLSSPGGLSSFNPTWNKNSSGRYMGSGSMVQVLAFYTGSLTNDQLLQNYNGLKGRYGL